MHTQSWVAKINAQEKVRNKKKERSKPKTKKRKRKKEMQQNKIIFITTLKSDLPTHLKSCGFESMKEYIQTMVDKLKNSEGKAQELQEIMKQQVNHRT